MKSHLFGILAGAILAITANAQKLLYENNLGNQERFQVFTCCIKTNTTVRDGGKDVPSKPYFIMKATLFMIDSNNATNILCETSYPDDRRPPLRFFPDEAYQEIVPLHIYDIHYQRSNRVVSILYGRDSLTLYCQFYENPPYPGKQLFHNHKNIGDDVCCRVSDNQMPFPNPFIETAKLQYDTANNRMEVVLKLNKHANGKTVIFVKTPEKWVRKEQ